MVVFPCCCFILACVANPKEHCVIEFHVLQKEISVMISRLLSSIRGCSKQHTSTHDILDVYVCKVCLLCTTTCTLHFPL